MIDHCSWSIDSYLSMTRHKLNSLNLPRVTSCSNLVSLPKIYVLKLEEIEAVESLLAGHDVLSNLPTCFGKKLNLPSVLPGKVEQKPEWECISSLTIQQHRQRTS